METQKTKEKNKPNKKKRKEKNITGKISKWLEKGKTQKLHIEFFNAYKIQFIRLTSYKELL